MSEQPDEHLQQLQQQALDEIARLHHEALRHIRHPEPDPYPDKGYDTE